VRKRKTLALGVAGVAGLGLTVARIPARPIERVPAFTGRSVTVVGHRGARGHAPENTLAGFERGLALGADAIELDVRLTADEHVVVLHDPTLDRTTDGSGPVAALPLDRVSALDAGYRWRAPHGSYPFRGEGLRVPTLAEVFAAFPDTFFVIELKPEAGPALAAAVAREIRGAGMADNVMAASSDRALLEVVRDVLPSLPTNLSEWETRTVYGLHLGGLHRRWVGRGRVLQVPEIHEGRRIVSPRFVAAAHDLGLDVQVWTVNAAEDMRRLIDWGVDGLVTDFPDRAVEAVRAAGL
jgi:glycerophosphoryl diester phosphodiesterase